MLAVHRPKLTCIAYRCRLALDSARRYFSQRLHFPLPLACTQSRAVNDFPSPEERQETHQAKLISTLVGPSSSGSQIVVNNTVEAA